jgi:DNA-binding LytR/AlgR family response regulator
MIPVANEETGEVTHIDERDILFLVVKRGTTYFHTWKGTYRRIKGAEEFAAIYEPKGFTRVDRHIFAQADKITRHDKLLRIAYFDHPESEYPTQACFFGTEYGKKLK